MASTPDRPGRAPLPSHTVGIGQALADSEPLALLGRRMRDSQARLAAVAPLLPKAMLNFVKAGPIDETGWSLLATNSAVAAKLRQMLPTLQVRLTNQGFDTTPVKVKLLGPT